MEAAQRTPTAGLVDPRDGDGDGCAFILFVSLSVQNTGTFVLVVYRSEWAPLLSAVCGNKVGHCCFFWMQTDTATARGHV
jgi:hypothetical protein